RTTERPAPAADLSPADLTRSTLMQALHLLLAAVTTFAQGRAPAAPIAPDRVQAPHRVAADLELSENLQGLEGLQGLAQGLQALQGALQSLVGLEGLDALDGSDSDAVLDPADSLWQTGRRALNRGDYSGAADLFGQIIKRYPRSARTPDAYYWAAFALYKTGDGDNLKQARTYLQTQGSRYPRAATRQDGKSLFAQIQSELARQGDQDAIIWVREHAAES